MSPDSCDEVVVEVVLDERRLAGGDRLARLAERVVLVAAAADRADGPAVGEDQHLGAGALRRRAVGADDRHQRARLAALERGRGGGKDLVHALVQMRTSIFDFFFSASMNASACCCFFCSARNCLICCDDSSNGTIAARLVVDHLDDVVAELRRDHVADLPGLELEGDLVERRHHLPLGEVIQVAALRGAAVLRVLLRELGEVAAGLRLLQHRVDLGARLLLGRGVGLLVDADQDVAGADRFVLLEAIGILLVEVLGLEIARAGQRRRFRPPSAW